MPSLIEVTDAELAALKAARAAEIAKSAPKPAPKHAREYQTDAEFEAAVARKAWRA